MNRLPEVITIGDSDDDFLVIEELNSACITVADSSDDSDDEFRHFAEMPGCNRPYVIEDLVPVRDVPPYPKHPIRVINKINDQGPFPGYVYLEGNTYPRNEEGTTFSDFCKCTNGRCLQDGCPCFKQSTIRIKKGRMAKLHQYLPFETEILIECSKSCGCRGQCKQSTFITDAIDFRCDIVMTKHAGFACFVREPIPVGMYVCEFTGDVGESENNVHKSETSYTYTVPCFTLKDKKMIIDPYNHGNVSRFFNHSCDPNLEPLRFYKEDRVADYPHLGFYAIRDIAANDELTIGYGIAWWQFSLENKRVKSCFCGSEFCILPPPESNALDISGLNRALTNFDEKSKRKDRKIAKLKEEIAIYKAKAKLWKKRSVVRNRNGPATKMARSASQRRAGN